MESIWTKTTERPFFETLEENKKTDTLIIGGGLGGLLCAYLLKQHGVDCIVVEADRICGATSANTTAKLTFQHGLIYDSMIRKYGVEKAGLYLEAQRIALKKYEDICTKTRMYIRLTDAISSKERCWLLIRSDAGLL